MNIRSTSLPPEPLPKFKWLSEICKKNFNPAQVNEHTVLGDVILKAYEINPEGTLEMIYDLARDNMQLMVKVIGRKNLNLFV